MNTVLTRPEIQALRKAAIALRDKYADCDGASTEAVEHLELSGAIEVLDRLRQNMNRYDATHCLLSPTSMGKEDW